MTEATSSNPVILNVDDYLPGRYARTKVLERMGFPVLEASSGAEALDMVKRHKPALVLLDVNLPDIHGFEVCRRLRADPETAGTTIVHISASSILSQHQVHGLDIGADGYIVEPVEPAVLGATIKAFIRARQAEERSRRSSDELRWFSYRVGHDLNEPLRTIAMYAQLLKARLGTTQGPEINGFLDFIGDATIRMRTLMDGLLQYAEMTQAESAPSPVNCEALVAHIIANLDGVVQQTGASITHDPLPVVVANDQLEHVFQNLVSNAIKYSRAGITPQVHIAARQEPAAWVFTVQDNGLGIEPEYREKIFAMFKRLHGSDIPGSGIGLALSRKIVESLGGTIWVESKPDIGSTFFFTIPADEAASELSVQGKA
jgi:two-component system sensor histidine kinase/response regulator